MQQYRLGWIPDLPDKRDFQRSLLRPFRGTLPSWTDLRWTMPPVYDQGALGSCTGNGIAGALQYERRRQGLSDYIPSRLFIYYNERAMEGTIGSDAGAAIRDGIKSVNTQGAPPESDWPYDISKFTIQPPPNCYTDGLQDCALQYMAVSQDLNSMRQCLAQRVPIVVGFAVYNSFFNPDRYGNIPMPGPNEALAGGHCTLVVGYLDKWQKFIVRNSWGPNWGVNGYCYMPYNYLTNSNLAIDFWSIELVGKGG